MKIRNKMGSGVTSLQYVADAKKHQARSLRKHATTAEAVLWEALRNRKAGGFKFRRQQVIEGFIADFYCEEAKLAVEIDGGVHATAGRREIDIHRERVFGARDIYTLRIKNETVIRNLRDALNLIITTAASRSAGIPTPRRAERMTVMVSRA